MSGRLVTQPVKAGDFFHVRGVRVSVVRVSRNPDKPWVDIACHSLSTGWMWTKRMPAGIPVIWPPTDGLGNPRPPREVAA